MVLARRPTFGLGAVSTAIAFLLLSNAQIAASVTTQETPSLCTAAARVAADKTGVPLSVLLAITLAETGRATENGLQPWPWAINQTGKGHWFSSPEEVVAFVDAQLDLGLRNFDVGCFQVNHRWHAKGFTSTVNMVDPASNALYAARFLADLYAEHGDWSLAAAAYHSRTPEFADKYRARFETILANLSDQPLAVDADIPPAPRLNRFPLLQAGAQGTSASLVPLNASGVRLIGLLP